MQCATCGNPIRSLLICRVCSARFCSVECQDKHVRMVAEAIQTNQPDHPEHAPAADPATDKDEPW